MKTTPSRPWLGTRPRAQARGLHHFICKTVFFLCICALASAASLQNPEYRIELLKDGSAEIAAGSMRRQVAPVFTILYAARDPQLTYRQSRQEAYVVPSWRARDTGTTMDLFQAGAQADVVRANNAELANGTVRWHFPERPSGKLDAELTLAPTGDPRIQFRFTPKAD